MISDLMWSALACGFTAIWSDTPMPPRSWRTASSAPTNFGFSTGMDWRLPANAAAILRLNKLICAFSHFLLAPAGIHPHVPDMQACVATDAALPSAFGASQARPRYVPKDVSTAMTWVSLWYG